MSKKKYNFHGRWMKDFERLPLSCTKEKRLLDPCGKWIGVVVAISSKKNTGSTRDAKWASLEI